MNVWLLLWGVVVTCRRVGGYNNAEWKFTTLPFTSSRATVPPVSPSQGFNISLVAVYLCHLHNVFNISLVAVYLVFNNMNSVLLNSWSSKTKPFKWSLSEIQLSATHTEIQCCNHTSPHQRVALLTWWCPCVHCQVPVKILLLSAGPTVGYTLMLVIWGTFFVVRG